MLTIRNYVRAQSLQEAYDLNQTKTNYILGGMMWLRMSRLSVGTAIDLGDLGLDKIEENEEEFSIGAMVTLRQLEKHEGLNAYSQDAVSKAVRDIVGVQFRNSATVGGSIFGRFGFSDVLTVFLSMNTYVELFNRGIVPLEEFAEMKRDRDLLVRLIVKKTPGSFSYLTMRNSRTDFPVLAVALSRMEGSYRLSVGARPGKAKLLTDCRSILSEGITEESSNAFAEYASDHIKTESNLRGSAAYRTHLLKVLTKRALAEIGGADNGN